MESFSFNSESPDTGRGVLGYGLTDNRLGIRLILARPNGTESAVVPADVFEFPRDDSAREAVSSRLLGHGLCAELAMKTPPPVGSMILAPSPHGEWLPEALDRIAAFLLEHHVSLSPGRGIRRRDLISLSERGASVVGMGRAADQGHSASLRAYSIVSCLDALLRSHFKLVGYDGLRVAIAGVGDAGGVLAKKLGESGARIYLTGRPMAPARALASKLGAVAIPIDEFATIGCQVLIITDPSLEGLILGDGMVRGKILMGDFGEFLQQNALRESATAGGAWAIPGWLAGAGSWIGLDEDLSGAKHDTNTLMRIRGLGKTLESWIHASASDGFSVFDHARRVRSSTHA